MTQPIRQIAIRGALIFLIVALIAFLYFCPPESTAYFPKCYFHWATGLHCPGCGAARCIHSLVHGDILQAAAYNILVLAALPFLVYAGLKTIHSYLRNRPRRASKVPHWATWMLITLIVVFWIVRNLNVEPFQLLAPHRLVNPTR